MCIRIEVLCGISSSGLCRAILRNLRTYALFVAASRGRCVDVKLTILPFVDEEEKELGLPRIRILYAGRIIEFTMDEVISHGIGIVDVPLFEAYTLNAEAIAL